MRTTGATTPGSVNNDQGQFNNDQGGDNRNFDNRNFGRDRFSRHDNRPPFSMFMRHFNFPHFAAPDFRVRPGGFVPDYYELDPLPPEFFFYYPNYRGYLYFVTPSGHIVIVSPGRHHRIIAIL